MENLLILSRAHFNSPVYSPLNSSSLTCFFLWKLSSSRTRWKSENGSNREKIKVLNAREGGIEEKLCAQWQPPERERSKRARGNTAQPWAAAETKKKNEEWLKWWKMVNGRERCGWGRKKAQPNKFQTRKIWNSQVHDMVVTRVGGVGEMLQVSGGNEGAKSLCLMIPIY